MSWACTATSDPPLPDSIHLEIDTPTELRGFCQPSGGDPASAGREADQQAAVAAARHGELLRFTSRRLPRDRFEVLLEIAGARTQMVQDFGEGYLEFESRSAPPQLVDQEAIAALASSCERALLSWGGLDRERRIRTIQPPSILKFLTFRALLAAGEAPVDRLPTHRVSLSMSLSEFEESRIRAHRSGAR